MQTALAAIFVFLIVVIFHEFGHFAVAKLVGIRVHEFAIGMGPKLLKFNKGETQYTIRALPIGGYVKMEGEDEPSDDIRGFNKKSISSRIAVISAGAIMNFVLALIVFSIYSFMIGTPTTIIDEVSKGLPAYEAGLRSGDQVIEINNEAINGWDELVNEINNSKGNTISFSIIREGKNLSFVIKPSYDNETGRYVVGISPIINKSFLSAIKGGYDKVIFVLGLMLQFIRTVITGQVNANDLSGPVGAIYVIGEAAKFGFLNVLYIAGFISINLGFFNLLPIPALDGSRLVFLIIEKLRGKPIKPEREGFIHLIGFIFLIFLMIVIAYKDFVRFDIF